MKLASLKAGGRDGTLIVVNRDLTQYVIAADVADTLQQAIDDWALAAPRLNALSEALNLGQCEDSMTLDYTALASPFPRAFEFVDGSAYLPHVERVNTYIALYIHSILSLSLSISMSLSLYISTYIYM